MTEPTPSPASTVLVCKKENIWPHEILLIKRSAHAAFLPGAHVFPGGRLEKSDKAFSPFLCQDQKNIQRIGAYFNDDTSTSLYVAAAIRETFEESSISILHTHDSNNKVVHCNAIMLDALLKNPSHHQFTHVTPVLDTIFPISWWITPKGESRRFDTRFFLALLSKESANLDDAIKSQEASEPVWILPQHALFAHENKHIFLAPPTRTILERMAATKDLSEFLSYVDRPLFPIKPYFVTQCQRKILVLPGDPLHHETKKASMPMHTSYSFY